MAKWQDFEQAEFETDKAEAELKKCFKLSWVDSPTWKYQTKEVF